MSAGLAAATILSTEAAAQMNNCAARASVIERLTGQFEETRQSVGLGANNAVVEVFGNTDTGTWSITVTLPNGLTCLVASGEAYETLAEALPPDGNDA
ncbi:MAG: hypothetical protein AAF330_05110 [Pseudomonadota bacterium]